jgi:uncharacterized membrane protein YadS
VIAFMLLIVLRTAGDAFVHPLSVAAASWNRFIEAGQSLSQLFLICGMTAVGLSVNFIQMRSVGWRPLVAAMTIAITVGVCSLSLTLTLQSVFH